MTRSVPATPIGAEPTRPSGGAAEAAPQRGPLAALIVELRPRQWTKNLIVFAALIFSANIDDTDRLLRSLAAFAIFCGLSGASYLINDLTDLERDRLHPKKCRRPTRGRPGGQGGGDRDGHGRRRRRPRRRVLHGLGLLRHRGRLLRAAARLQLRTQALVIIDAMTIAAGFVLRVVAGAFAIDVPISPWIILCTALLALFLALVKRRYELVTVEDPRHPPAHARALLRGLPRRDDRHHHRGDHRRLLALHLLYARRGGDGDG